MIAISNQQIPIHSGLRLCLLGSPSVTWDDDPVSIPRRRVRALLYRLASSPQPVCRQHLQLLFWPDMPEEIARRNLSHNLTHLRRSLPIPETVVSIGNRVWLEPELVWCDVIQFINLEREPQHKDSDFRRAINLYRGSFLEGFDLPGSAEFEHWCLVKRTGLERLYLDALGFMIDYCTSHWEITSAIQFARRYLEIDELAETVHRRLIALYAATGDRHAAMKQYEFCSGVLERELGVVPLPETLQIYQAVLRGSPHFPKPGQGKHVPGLPEMDLPPVGREL